jgi:hypothetical protein
MCRSRRRGGADLRRLRGLSLHPVDAYCEMLGAQATAQLLPESGLLHAYRRERALSAAPSVHDLRRRRELPLESWRVAYAAAGWSAAIFSYSVNGINAAAAVSASGVV